MSYIIQLIFVLNSESIDFSGIVIFKHNDYEHCNRITKPF